MRQPRRPKLGQHFLTDTRFCQRIAEAIALRPEDLVIEIGAGRGAMTELLAKRAGRVVAIELDAALAAKLRLRAQPQIEIVQADILATDLNAICERCQSEKCFVFGNLPYYITSPILHHLFSFSTRIRAMALLVQREVARRLAARPGTRDYGYLSVLAQLYSQPRLALGVPPGAFSPAPKVHSALVAFQMTPKFPHWRPENRIRFLDFVKRCFAQKRKNLLNNLSGIHLRQRVEQELARLALPATIRAEQLTLEQFASLFRSLG